MTAGSAWRSQSRPMLPRCGRSVDVNDPARLGMEYHRAIVDDRVVMPGHAVLLGHRIGLIGSGRQLAADHDFIVIAIGRPGFAVDVSPQRLALFIGHHYAGGDSRT